MSESTSEMPSPSDVHELETGLKEKTVREVVDPYTTAIAAAEERIQSESWDDLDTFKVKKVSPKPRGWMLFRRQKQQSPYSGAEWRNEGNNDMTYESNLQFPTDEDPFRRYTVKLLKEGEKEVPTLRLDQNKDTLYTFGMLTWTKDSSSTLRDLFTGQEDVLELMETIEDFEEKERVNKYEIYFDVNETGEDAADAKFSFKRIKVGPGGAGEFDKNAYEIEVKLVEQQGNLVMLLQQSRLRKSLLLLNPYFHLFPRILNLCRIMPHYKLC